MGLILINNFRPCSQICNFAPSRPPCRSGYPGRKVRTPQCSIAGNARLPFREGQVQQKVCTGNAVVKSGKLYAVKRHVYQRLRVARPS